MVKNEAKTRLIADLHENRNTESAKMVLGMLDILIQEARESNDTARGVGIFHNQGKIDGFLTLREYFVRGLPFLG